VLARAVTIEAMTAKIVVGVDGSTHSERAVRWCAEHAAAFKAEVVVVHVINVPISLMMGPYYSYPELTPEQREELRDVIGRDWCKPLADAGVAHRVVLMECSPAVGIIHAAHSEQAELVVVGRRGRGGFAELVLGSTSDQLSHHLDRPLVIVP
jgi:nucleotide-binding universal stress UspA family protein